MLLEYAYSCDYQGQINILSQEHHKSSKEIKDNYSKILLENEQKQNIFREQLKQLKDQSQKAEDQLRYAENERVKLQTELEKNMA